MKLKSGPPKGKGGRPSKEDSVRTGIKVSYELRDILDSERQNKERYNDTILRIIKERAAVRQEVDQLRSQLEQLRLTGVFL
jgi:hypothetical protein